MLKSAEYVLQHQTVFKLSNSLYNHVHQCFHRRNSVIWVLRLILSDFNPEHHSLTSDFNCSVKMNDLGCLFGQIFSLSLIWPSSLLFYWDVLCTHTDLRPVHFLKPRLQPHTEVRSVFPESLDPHWDLVWQSSQDTAGWH